VQQEKVQQDTALTEGELNMKKLVVMLLVSVVLTFAATIPASAGTNADQVQVMLRPVGNSGVSGLVKLIQRKNHEGTHIVVVAFGLKPKDQYISLYYDNHVCKLEPYSLEDVIGGIYSANKGGVGTTEGNADDDLDEINSVSVRHAGDFKLLACANVHP
jgi:hypothetical protein